MGTISFQTYSKISFRTFRLLHSLFTADSKEVIIRDIIKRYTDSSTAIWAGKPRLFFIQACRSLWPENNLCNNREAIKENDLSPMMLVAYSCSANEASKRSPTLGSIFIQILCIMLLRYSHWYVLYLSKFSSILLHLLVFKFELFLIGLLSLLLNVTNILVNTRKYQCLFKDQNILNENLV